MPDVSPLGSDFSFVHFIDSSTPPAVGPGGESLDFHSSGITEETWTGFAQGELSSELTDPLCDSAD